MRVGIGIHAGEPVSQEGDFIGSAVNVAARIGAAAGAGQLLVTDVVRGLVRTDAPFPLQDRGPVLLKGLSEPIHLYEVAWGGQPNGDSPALSVVVSGQARLSYQWYQGASGDTQHAVGANSASFSPPPLYGTTRYWVRASNGSGSADSDTAILTTTASIYLPLLISRT